MALDLFAFAIKFIFRLSEHHFVFGHSRICGGRHTVVEQVFRISAVFIQVDILDQEVSFADVRAFRKIVYLKVFEKRHFLFTFIGFIFIFFPEFIGNHVVTYGPEFLVEIRCKTAGSGNNILALSCCSVRAERIDLSVVLVSDEIVIVIAHR